MSFIDDLAQVPPGTPPAIAESSRLFVRVLLWFGGLGMALAFLLPESDVLSRTAFFQFLEKLVPSAAKAASVAQYPNVVRVYFSLMLTLAPLLALYLILLCEPWRARISTIAGRSILQKLKAVALGLLAVLVFTALNLLFYFLPGSVSAIPGGSRGQLMFSLIVMTKPGLATLGSLLSIGVFTGWWVLLLVSTLTFLTPFQPGPCLPRNFQVDKHLRSSFETTSQGRRSWLAEYHLIGATRMNMFNHARTIIAASRTRLTESTSRG